MTNEPSVPPPPATSPPRRHVPTWLKWVLGASVVLILISAIGGSTSELSKNAPAGAKVGTWDAECEAGIFNTCDEEEAVDNLKAVEVHCRWSGPDVIVHVKLDSTFNARLEVGVVPRYVIEDGGQHGTSFGSEETKVVDARGSVIFDINAGHPKGVPVGAPISECKPKLYNVALKGADAAPVETKAPTSSGNAQGSSKPAAPALPRKPRSPRERLRVALRKLDARLVESSSAELTIHAKTPAGGLQGASTGDLNRAAQDIFMSVYRDAGYTRATVIVFKGGLVDTRTGKDLPDVNTGIFTMSRSDAAAIDWDDEDRLLIIDWTNFRDFAHPALKQDD